MPRQKKQPDSDSPLEGSLNILGLKIDLGELLTSPEGLQERLEELREKLKAAGGKETLSDEEWRQGGVSVGGYIRTRGVAGTQEFHIGTAGKPAAAKEQAAAAAEVAEPPVDVFYEGDQVTVIADVPGASQNDLEVQLQEKRLTISTKPAARRRYRKDLDLETPVAPDSLRWTCNNGVLEVHLQQKK
ncbi:MAG: Hsp20 family protein [Chloroflexi bacterium]|nr:Hsp20 family protein [Chloroflexota bacterium]